MRLADVVDMSVKDRTEPAAALAMAYAERIDECGHVRSALVKALDDLEYAARLADESATTDRVNDTYLTAFRKVAAVLSAVTVAAELGPKLLAALDALLLTPKSRAAVGEALTPTPAPKRNPVAELRAEEDELERKRRAKRAG